MILQNPNATGRIVEWALELSNFGLKFESTSMIQSRALAEFVAEWTQTPDEEVPETVIPGKEAPQEWNMYFDCAFPYKVPGLAFEENLKYVIQMHFSGKKPPTILLSMKGYLPGLEFQQNWELRS